jgi:hypothetical protein
MSIGLPVRHKFTDFFRHMVPPLIIGALISSL